MSGAWGPRAGVICVGSIIVDQSKVIDAYPVLEHLAMIEHVSLSTGGPALNVAIDLRRLGASFPIELAGAIGDDRYAALVLAECTAQGIDTTNVQQLPGAITAFTDAMVERVGGRRTLFHHRGANALFDGSKILVEGCQARILHAGAPGIHPLMDSVRPEGGNGWSQLLRRAQAAGLRTNLELVSLGADRITEVAAACLPHLDSIVINEWEAGALTGVQARPITIAAATDWVAVEAMAVGLLDRGVGSLAVVHFPTGCVAAAPGGRTWRQGSVRLSPDHVLSTTGAGDAFGAGVLLGLHERLPIERCLQLAVASAAASVTSLGTSDGIRAAEVCLAEADSAGYRATS